MCVVLADCLFFNLHCVGHTSAFDLKITGRPMRLADLYTALKVIIIVLLFLLRNRYESQPVPIFDFRNIISEEK
jgi:hypothetical protein